MSPLRLHRSVPTGAAASVVLGVDPGTRRAGFAVLRIAGGTVECRSLGTLTAPAGWPLARRLTHLAEAMAELVRRGPVRAT